MLRLGPNLAATSETPSGISALGLNFKAFIFQLITFVIVFLVLRRYVFSRLVKAIERRQQVVEHSLAQARQTEKTLHEAESKAAEILTKARQQADEALQEAKLQAKEIIAAAEVEAAKRADRLIKDAEGQIKQEQLKLGQELKRELASLVALATSKVLRHKVDTSTDERLIQTAIKESQ